MIKRILILSALLMSFSQAWAEKPSLSQIIVYGTAVKMAAPDQITWRLNVNNAGRSLKKTASQHAAILKATLDFLKGSKIRKDEIQTADMRFGEKWRHGRNGRVKEGYYASTDIAFKLTDLEKHAELWLGLAEIESVGVRETRFGMSKKLRMKLRKEAGREALLAAKNKAAFMAGVLGAKLGRLIRIKEETPFNGRPQARRANAEALSYEAAQTDNIIEPGKIPVKSGVKTVFGLVHPQ